MKKSTELRAELQTEIDAQNAIVETAKNDSNRSLNEAETTDFNASQTKIEALRASLKMAEQFEENQRASAQANAVPVLGSPVVDSQEVERSKMMKKYSFHKALRSQMKNGSLDGIEKEIHEETVSRAKEAGVMITGLAIPDFASQKRADGQTVTQDSGAYGGNLVGEDLQAPIEFLRPKPLLETLGARMLTGLQGNLVFPTNDGGIKATWEGEVDTIDATKTAYGKKTMAPNRLGVNALISLQNIMQTGNAIERFTIDDINAAISNAMDYAAINGPGSDDQPLGILNTSGINVVSAGDNGAVPSWSNIVDMESQVYIANANSAKMSYLMNPATKGVLKKTKHSAGDLNYLMGTDNSINGYSAGITNLMPSDLTKGTGEDLSAALFGDFSQLIMGQWGFYDFTVDEVSRKKDGYVALIVNTFLDCLVRQDKAFTAVKDWIV